MNLTPTADALCPKPFEVHKMTRETLDVFTFELRPTDPAGNGAVTPFSPGQFNMLYAFGIGEVPISMSGNANKPDRLVHTVRMVGPVTRALGALRKGDYVGVRGPFGAPWPVQAAQGRDIVVVAGGIGLAPLRPVIYEVLDNRAAYRRMSIVYGARTPKDLLFSRELQRWAERRDVQFDVTVDTADAQWSGTTGVVTRLLSRLYCRPERAVAMICGPEVMMRFAARELLIQGYDPHSIYVSTERNMKCAVGLCGRCQLGSRFICRDGPVFRYDQVQTAMAIREL